MLSTLSWELAEEAKSAVSTIISEIRIPNGMKILLNKYI